jgi:hypothetical protein
MEQNLTLWKRTIPPSDETISGLRTQLSALGTKIQELNNLFDNFDNGGAAGGVDSNVVTGK